MRSSWRLAEQKTGRTLVEQLEIADRFWARLVGLQLRRTLPSNAGLLLVPCTSIHTLMMRFSIDAVMLSRHAEVLGVHQNVRPWRLALGVRGTYAILELPAGLSLGIERGAQVRIQPTGPIDRRLSGTLQGWCS